MKQTLILVGCSIIVSLAFFWKTVLNGLLPIPADALVGLYHPYRDFFASTNPQGIAYKNFILTDPVLQQYPWKWLAINDWKETLGDVFKGPALLWQGRALSHLQDNPYNFSGTPLLANIQAGVFYPLNVLFFLGDFRWMWTIYIILGPILAMFFMALWLSNHRFSLFPQLFGGFVWAFSSFNLVWLEWGNIGHAGLWLPLALFCIDKMKMERLKIKNNMKWFVLFQFSLTSSLFAGHFQITLYLLLAVLLYWLLCLGITKRSLLFFIFHLSTFIFLTSVQWIPSLQLALTSNREVEQQDVLTREGFFIHPKQFIQMIAPDFFGNPSTQNYRGKWNYAEQIIYIGILPFLLALVGGCSGINGMGKNEQRKKFWLFSVTIVVISLLFSTDNPIARFPYVLKVPFLMSLQPTRLSYLATFGLSMLSILGMDRMLRFSQKDRKIVALSIGVIATALVSSLIFSSKFLPEDRFISQRNLVFPGLLLVVSFTWSCLLLVRSSTRFSLFIVHCALLIAAIDLFRFGWKFTPFSPVQYLYPTTPAIQFLQSHMGPGDQFMTLDRRIFPPNANIMYRLRSINGYDPVYARDYASKITEMESGGRKIMPSSFGRIIVPMNYISPIAKDLQVRYLLSLSDIDDLKLTKVFQEGETRVYQIN